MIKKKRARKLSSSSSFEFTENKPAFALEKINSNLTYFDQPDAKTIGLRKITKPVFNQLKESIYDFHRGNPIFEYAPLQFEKIGREKSGWLYLYNDIKKSTKGYAYNLQLKKVIKVIERDSYRQQQFMRDLTIGKRITFDRPELRDIIDTIKSQKGSFNDSWVCNQRNYYKGQRKSHKTQRNKSKNNE